MFNRLRNIFAPAITPADRRGGDSGGRAGPAEPSRAPQRHGFVRGGHINKFRAVAITVALALGSLVGAAPVAAAGNTTYYGCTPLSTDNSYIIVKKTIGEVTQVPGATYFSYGRGDATVQRLYPCDQNLGTGGLSAVLAANLEGDGGIYQIGYGADSFGSHDNRTMRFYYTPNGDGNPTAWTGSFTPTIGKRYRFSIRKELVGYPGLYMAKYSITNLSDGGTETQYGIWNISGQPGTAWWGFERQNIKSQMGPAPNNYVHLAYMGYQVNLNTSPSAYFRTDLVYSVDIHDTENDSLGYIGDWFWNNDMLDVFNDGSPG